MRLVNDFTIATDPDRAFDLLLDLERVAPCVPGAELGSEAPDGSRTGRVSVRLGPMKLVYDGRVRITERDGGSRTAVISGEGRAGGGADTARMTATMKVTPSGNGSRVEIVTDLEIRGRAAQMGQGIIADVSRRLVRDAATCIEARLAAPADTDPDELPVAKPAGAISLVASAVSARVGGSVRRLAGRNAEGDSSSKGDHDAAS